jgi:DNA-binding GntR family transcriptional regulator
MDRPAKTLTHYVEEDIRRRIQSGQDLPRPLTLASLSNHYGVSFAPVRSALDSLLKEGLIHKNQNNGRLLVNPDRVGVRGSYKPVACPLTSDDWDRILIKEVMVASLNGTASFLREEALAHKHNIGRSVIRSAFSRFAGAGLIEHIPRHGWQVRPLNPKDMRAYLQIRETLELKALDLAKSHLVRDDLMQMLAGNQPDNYIDSSALDNRLHDYIIEKSGNHYIRDFFRQYVAMYYRTLFHYAAPETSVVMEMAAQHRRILEALIARSWNHARLALKEHIQSQERVLGRLLALVDGKESPSRRQRGKPARSS